MKQAELPPVILNFAAQNEDAAVEDLLLREVARESEHPLRVLAIASCGTNVLSMSASPEVAVIDAVDVSEPQLMLARLTCSAAESLETADELAALLGNSDDPIERAELYARARGALDDDVRQFWDDNRATVEAGILACGGSERLYTAIREHLPSRDARELARDPDGVAAAVRSGFSMENLQKYTVGIPDPILGMIADRVVPAIIGHLNERLANLKGDAGFILRIFLEGSFPMKPEAARPRFLQRDVVRQAKENGCGPERVRFHEGPIQVVGKDLAEADGPYDVADLSNILDMAPPEMAHGLLREVTNAVRPGGWVLCRWSNRPGVLAKMFGECGIEVDEEMSRRLTAAETSFFMTEVCAGTV